MYGGILFNLLSEVTFTFFRKTSQEMFNILLHALVLLILEDCELNHLLDVLIEIVYLQLQSVAVQVLFQNLKEKQG